MADPKSPRPLKRPRADTGSATKRTPNGTIPASSKRRKLDRSAETRPTSTSTPPAIAGAVVSPSGRQKKKKGATADAYDVPDSDFEDGEDLQAAHSTAVGKKRRRGNGNPTKDVYDPVSLDEDEIAEAPQLPSPRKLSSSTGKPSSGRGKGARQSPASADTEIEDPKQGTEDTSMQSLDDDNNASVRSSARRRKPSAKLREGQEVTRIRRESSKSRSRSASVSVPAPAVNETTPTAARHGQAGSHVKPLPLKGILTPSKKNGVRNRKSVAFGADETDPERPPLTFEDVGKMPRKKKQSPSVAKSTKPIKPVKAAKPIETPEIQHSELFEPQNSEQEKQDGDEDEPQEETVCSMCSKPNSRPPNEILLCDGCDLAVHQKCYGVREIPSGDWFCKKCIAEKQAKAEAGAQVPNFEHHLRSLQRVLLDRCSGRRRIKLIDQEEAQVKTHQLLEQTVLAGEGNSMLVIGARGSGKTTLVEGVVGELSAAHAKEFHVVRLNGFIHTDDKLALMEIWRQLGREMDVDDSGSGVTNYADTMASLLALLSHPSEISQSEEGVTSRAVIFIIDEFDMFATHPRQTLLYNLFDIAQSRKAPIAVLGCTTRMDVVESLEKRVKSRFSHRYVYLSLPKSQPAFWNVCKQGLTIDDDDMKAEGIDTSVEGHVQFYDNWNKMIDELYKKKPFLDLLRYHYFTTKSIPSFLSTFILPLSRLAPGALDLEIPSTSGAIVSLAAPNSKLHLLAALSDLDLGLLIAAARLDIVAHTDTVNFAMAYDEYGSLMGRQRVQSATSGMMALGGGVRVWGRGVAGVSWERLISLGLLLPAGIGGGRTAGSGGHGGLEGRMWKVDVALEDIPAGAKLSQVLTRWCKEV